MLSKELLNGPTEHLYEVLVPEYGHLLRGRLACLPGKLLMEPPYGDGELAAEQLLAIDKRENPSGYADASCWLTYINQIFRPLGAHLIDRFDPSEGRAEDFYALAELQKYYGDREAAKHYCRRSLALERFPRNIVLGIELGVLDREIHGPDVLRLTTVRNLEEMLADSLEGRYEMDWNELIVGRWVTDAVWEMRVKLYA